MTAPEAPHRMLGLPAMLLAIVLMASACGGTDEDAATTDETATSENGDETDEAASEVDPDDTSDGDSSDEAGTDEAASDEDGDGSEDAADFPRNVQTAAGTVTIESRPTSVVSLSPTATEMLFAIGAGDLVTAVDQYSNYPPEAPQGTLDGLIPDLEAILSSEPDLVVASGLPPDVFDGLADSEVAVMLLPTATSFDDTYDQIAQLGEATGHIDEAAALNAEIRQGVADIVASLPESDVPVKVFHEIDDSFYTATSNSFIGQVYAEMGFENVADPFDDGTGFPLVDGESVIAADPSLIVFTDQAPYSRADIEARPGWNSVTAVSSGNIVQVDADIASRWGPRIIEFMEAVAAVITVDA